MGDQIVRVTTAADGVTEAEVSGLLERDVQKSEILQLLGSAQRADIDRAQSTVGDELGDRQLGPLIVAGDEHVERLPPTSPRTSVGANVVLNALTTGVPAGTSCWTSSAEELPGGVTRLSQVSVSTGLVMSTTTFRRADPRTARPPP
jgi:hypothetical protein